MTSSPLPPAAAVETERRSAGRPRVLIGCERFAVVRDAFLRRGFDAWSCDLAPATGPHIQGDILDQLDKPWHLLIVHPDCTFLTGSAEWAYSDANFDRYPGVGYHQKVKPETLTGAERRKSRDESLDFVRRLFASRMPLLALENPVGVIGSRIRKPDQIIQPHQFGDDASKATCLWLRNLPRLIPTQHVAPRMVNGKPRWANQTDNGQNGLSPTKDPNERAMARAKTYPGIAEAMAAQWGNWIVAGKSEVAA